MGYVSSGHIRLKRFVCMSACLCVSTGSQEYHKSGFGFIKQFRLIFLQDLAYFPQQQKKI